jgi:hypothetical protein
VSCTRSGSPRILGSATAQRNGCKGRGPESGLEPIPLGTLAEADLRGVDVNEFPPEMVGEMAARAALGPGLSLSSAAARYKAQVA